jgi:hypothetical protein
MVALATAIPQTLEQVAGAKPTTNTHTDLFQIPVESQGDLLSQYGRSSFQPYINSIFEILYGTTWIPLTLSAVADTGAPKPPKSKRQLTTDVVQEHRFSLMFHGSADTPFGQDVYHVRHAALGSFQLLVVPVGLRHRDPLYYEAIINRVQQ